MADDSEHERRPGDRIAKVIARAGLASRREAELWIAAGRVAINGAAIDSPATNVTERDRISVDGVPLPARERTRLFLYHKQRGLMTTHADPRGRATIFQKLPRDLPRLISVGRLDYNTEGLLLLTNDGALARVLELPATGWLRRYRVRAHGSVSQDKLDALRNGVTLSGIHYGEIEAAIDRVQGTNVWLTFAIREGKNREVRNVLGHLGLDVSRLIRVSFGPFKLGELAEGAVEEVPTRVLREQLGARLVALSEADFSTPVAAAPPPMKERETPRVELRPPPMKEREIPRGKPRPPRMTERETPRGKPRPSPMTEREKPRGKLRPAPINHAWRDREPERPGKPLRRKFRGSRRDDANPREHPKGPARATALTDRSGRHVAVERYGQPPTPKPRDEEPKQQPAKRGRRGRRAPDRASGARPRQPRGRR